MLVLSRCRGESIVIGGAVVVTVLETRGDKVRIGISAPTSVAVHRSEIYSPCQAVQHDGGPDIADGAASDGYV